MPYVIAVDIGGTKIESALFNHKCKLLAKKRLYFEREKSDPTVNLSKNRVLGLINNAIELFYSKKIMGIGISIPDIINKKGAIVGTSKIKALSNYSLRTYLQRRYRCRITVNNDADCFALGEARLGAGRGYDNVAGVIWGTGVGSGLVLHKQLYSGTTGSAGEFGHNIVNAAGPKDRVGLKGTVEAYAGGANIVNNYVRAGGKMKDPETKKIFASKERIAKKTIKNALEHLGIGLASIMNLLNPGVIVMGGGLSNRNVYRDLNKYTKKYTVDGLRPLVRVVRNKLGDSAGIYGAAVMVLEK